MPPWQVRLALPETRQEPVQVMLQVPPPQTTLELAPTVWVQDLPEQLTLQLAPQVPVQVASESQLNWQLEVELSQASKEHEVPVGQMHDVPAQTLEPQPVVASATRTMRESRTVRMGSPGRVFGPQGTKRPRGPGCEGSGRYLGATGRTPVAPARVTVSVPPGAPLSRKTVMGPLPRGLSSPVAKIPRPVSRRTPEADASIGT